MSQKDNKKKKTLRKWIINILILILLIVGLILVFNVPVRNVLIGKGSNDYKVVNTSSSTLKKNKKAKVSYDMAAVEPVSFDKIVKSRIANGISSKDNSDSKNLPIVAGIAIPDLGVNLPIFQGIGNTELTYGAGTMKEGEEPGKGNYALASHHVTGMGPGLLFTPLEDAQIGQMIYISDNEKIYEYKITKTGVYDPNRVDLIEDNGDKATITLVTCSDMQATHRIIVFGDFVKSYKTDDASQDVKSAFETNYTAMYS